MGWQGNSLFPLLIITSQAGTPTGLFEYDPSPAAGNLVASVTEATADPYGNKTYAGVAVYQGQAPGDLITVLQGGVVYFTATNGALNRAASAQSVSSDGLLLTSGSLFGTVKSHLEMVNATNNPYPVSSDVIMPWDPVAGYPSPEAWHDMNLVNGWSTSGSGLNAARYRLTNDNTVMIVGDITSGTTTDGTNITVMPAAYHPADAHLVCPIMIPGTSTIGNARLFVQASGGLQVDGISSLGGGTRIAFNASYSLDV